MSYVIIEIFWYKLYLGTQLVQNWTSLYFVKKQLPTLLKLHVALREDINFQERIATLHKVLHSIGFQYKRCQSKRKILIERYDITAWRAKYIVKMRKNRNVEKSPLIFLDETYMHNTCHVKNFWQSKEEPGVSLLSPLEVDG